MPESKSGSRDNTTLREKAEKLLSLRPAKGLPPDPTTLTHELEVYRIELEMQNEELRRSHLEVEKSREKYFELYDLAPVGYLTLNEKGMITEINLTAAGLLGIERRSLINKPFSRFIQPEFHDVFYMYQRQALESTGRHTCELALKTRDASLLHAQLDSIAVEVDGQKIIRTALTDITERKRMEDELRRYQLLARHGRDIILFIRGADGAIVEANDAAVKAYGYSKEELLSLKIYDLRGPTGYPLTYTQMDVADSSGILFETEHRRKDGTTFPVEVSSRGITVGSERVLLSVIRDITERTQAAKAIDESARRVVEILESIGEAFFSLDENLVFTYFNATAEHLLKRNRKDIIGKPFEGAFPEAVGSLFHRNYVRAIREKTPMTFEAFFEAPPYENWYDVRIYPRGKGISVFFQVITERKRVEDALRKAHEELERRVRERTADLKEALESLKSEAARREQMEERIRQTEKMEAIGTLSGGIAHDFNNILAAVLGFTEMAIDSNVPRNSAMDQSLKHVLKAAFRGRDLVKQILAFSRKTHHEIVPLQLSPLIRETVKFLRASLPSTVKIEVRVKSTSDKVLADPSQVQQVIMNLCTNGAFAMGDKGGRLTITVSDASGSALPSGLAPRPHLLLTVKDTGTGMEPDTLKRIFEPFFTTKEPGQGTGMGLAVAYGIVKSLHGEITVKSEQGKGSLFKVFLPKAELSVQPDESVLGDIPRGSELILFVDDENELLQWGRETLRGLGYRVIGTTDSRDALSLFLLDPNRFDAVITDYTMPAMTGFALAQELLKVRPDIPIILLTGYTANISPEDARAAGIREFLMKPLAKREVAEAIRRVLDEERAQR
ncbi:MAG TPA: PAS domain S-box protein [Syntrophorhabdaceae bacterium]|jgi:PAS domain S-box-containing protein